MENPISHLPAGSLSSSHFSKFPTPQVLTACKNEEKGPGHTCFFQTKNFQLHLYLCVSLRA